MKDSEFFLVFYDKSFKIFHAVGFEGIPLIKDIYKEVHSLRETYGEGIYEQIVDVLSYEEMNSLINHKEKE